MKIKPLTKSKRVPVLQEIRGMSLTMSAPEVLLRRAKVVSEGETENAEDVSPSYSGTTLVSVDLTAADLDIDLTEENQLMLLKAVKHSLLLHVCLIRLARLETERRCAPLLIREINFETEFQIDGENLLVDIYVDCSLAHTTELEGVEKGGDA